MKRMAAGTFRGAGDPHPRFFTGNAILIMGAPSNSLSSIPCCRIQPRGPDREYGAA